MPISSCRRRHSSSSSTFIVLTAIYYVVLNQPAIEPLGEALPNSEVFRRLSRAMGFTDSCFSDTDEELIRQAIDSPHPNMRGSITTS
jgi:anaerobic selenocysteine-containing dehydrogenase